MSTERSGISREGARDIDTERGLAPAYPGSQPSPAPAYTPIFYNPWL